MQTTSHFLGLALLQNLLDDLFDKLSEYIQKHQLDNAIQLQSRDSLHITIYYLDATLSDNEYSVCRELLKVWTIDRYRNIHLRRCEYFYRDGLPCILYIVPDNISYFSRKNKQANEGLHRDDIGDNQFPFSPHFTIMRISDPEKFFPHADVIEYMIQSYIEGLWDEPMQDGFALYRVNSRISPELQERLALN